MSPRSLSSKTHRFLEALAFLTVLIQLATPQIIWFLIVPDTLAVIALTAAFVYRPLRHLGWLAAVSAGLSSMLFRPDSVGGIILVLIAGFLVFDSGWSGRWNVQILFLFVALVVATQVASVFFAPDGKDHLIRVLLTDSIVAVLIVFFQKDLFFSPPVERPSLSLSDRGLTPRERQIIHLVWGGETPKEIAGFLGLSDGSVRMRLSRIYRKLEIAGLKELSHLVHTHRIVWESSHERHRGS